MGPAAVPVCRIPSCVSQFLGVTQQTVGAGKNMLARAHGPSEVELSA
jgi:hypothetical protein